MTRVQLMYWRRWSASGLLAAILVMVPPGAEAQGVRWWQTDPFRQQLGLTAEQSTRIDDVFQTTLPALKRCYQNLETLENGLSRLISENNITEAQVLQEVARVEAARTELSKTRTLMLFHMRRILTPEQRVKLKALNEQWDKDRRKRDSPGPSR